MPRLGALGVCANAPRCYAHEPIGSFYIIEPYADDPGSLHQATVLSEHVTAEAAFSELERMTKRLPQFNISAGSVGRR